MKWPRAFLLGAIATGSLLALRRGARPRFEFADKTVVVTGGSRGLGLLLARRFAAEGARLALLARDESELDRARADIEGRGGTAVSIPCDVTDRGQVASALSRVAAHYGRIDVLVNNAGIIQVGPLDSMDESDFAEAMDTHFWGPLYATLEVVDLMRRQGGGRIVNISSIGGKIAVPHLLPYTASKFALTGLSDGLRVELASENIRVTTVCPGLMRTGSHVRAEFKGSPEDEFMWFSLLGSTPALSISGERAAARIVEACRRGDAELVITPPAAMAATARTLLPGPVAWLESLVERLLARMDRTNARAAVEGRQLPRPRWSRAMTTLSDRAAARNNEI